MSLVDDRADDAAEDVAPSTDDADLAEEFDDLDEADDLIDAPAFPRLLPWLLVVLGTIGLAAASALIIEKIALLKDPSYVPSCSFNPVLSCGSVMITEQAEVFGFPNPLLGLVGFSVVITTGAALLAGATLRRWYWVGLQIGATLGLVFVHWLVFQSLYRIGALCPYCMVVWAVTIPIFVYVTLANLDQRRLGIGGERPSWADSLVRYHPVILLVWFAVIAGLILQRFWDYWLSLIT